MSERRVTPELVSSLEGSQQRVLHGVSRLRWVVGDPARVPVQRVEVIGEVLGVETHSAGRLAYLAAAFVRNLNTL